MTGELAQARPSRSQRSYLLLGTRIKFTIDAVLVAALAPRRSDLGDHSYLAEPNPSDLKTMIAIALAHARKTDRLLCAIAIGDNFGDFFQTISPAVFVSIARNSQQQCAMHRSRSASFFRCADRNEFFARQRSSRSCGYYDANRRSKTFNKIPGAINDKCSCVRHQEIRTKRTGVRARTIRTSQSASGRLT